jgi:antitoxin YefM
LATIGYSEARACLEELLDQVTRDREPVIITRRGHEAVALIAAGDLDALVETVHLLRSRTNAERLLTSLARANAGAGTSTNLATLRAELNPGDG